MSRHRVSSRTATNLDSWHVPYVPKGCQLVPSLRNLDEPNLVCVEMHDTCTAPERPRALTPRDAGVVQGTQLDHFRIERKLGAGGMGEVYLATDLMLDRPVAIKVLRPDAIGDEAMRRRLIHEAQAQGKIHHPNVGHIYFAGEDGHRVYFAM